MTFIKTIIFIFLLSPGLLLAEFPQDYIKNYQSQIQNKIPVNLQNIPKGSLLTINWSKTQVGIYHKTNEDIELLESINNDLADPNGKNNSDYLKKSYFSSTSTMQLQITKLAFDQIGDKRNRTLLRDYFIFTKISPATGCAINLKDPRIYNSDKRRLFYDPCSKTSYDAAGRVFKGPISHHAVEEKNAKYNLALTPYYVESKTKIVIGFKQFPERLPDLALDHRKMYKGKNPTQVLMIAARFNDKEMITKALNMRANVNYPTIGAGSPIDAAIIGSSTDIVVKLLKMGAKPTDVSRQIAQILGRSDVLKLLHDK